jgi:pimeloyl-ACP methyl ester carboxylesterase
MDTSTTAIAAIALPLIFAFLATTPVAHADDARFLDRPGGKVAYSDSGGDGPLIVCVPGIGDTRAEYRFLTPLLVRAGFRVVAMDPRGMGQSSVTFDDYSAAAVGSDITALIQNLGAQRAWVAGNSAAGASAVWAAAEIPDKVRGIILIDPSIIEEPLSFWLRAVLWTAMHRPWGPAFWSMFYKTLYKSAPPSDLPQYREALEANLKEPGRFEALDAALWAPKKDCEQRMSQVRTPALVIMGSADPDFGDPAAVAQQVADRVHGQVVMVAGAGHYPQVEQPELVAHEIIEFVGKAPH